MQATEARSVYMHTTHTYTFRSSQALFHQTTLRHFQSTGKFPGPTSEPLCSRTTSAPASVLLGGTKKSEAAELILRLYVGPARLFHSRTKYKRPAESSSADEAFASRTTGHHPLPGL